MKIALILPSNLKCAPNSIAGILYHNLKYKFHLNVYVINQHHEANLEFPPFECSKLSFKSLFAVLECDLVHTMGFKPDAFGFLLRLLNFKGLLVTTLHSEIKYDLIDIFGKTIGVLFYRLWLNFLRVYDCRIHINNISQSTFLNYSFRGVDVCIPNTIIPIQNLAPKINTIDTGCLFVGSIRPLKGIETIIAAIDINKAFKIDVYGGFINKKYKLKITSYINKTSTTNFIRFMGYSDNMHEVYGRYNILVVSSISEGFGLVILEAILAGLYVICNDIPSLRSLYDRNPVIFYKYNDPHDLQLKIQETLNLNRPNTSEIEYYQKKFSVTNFVLSHLRIYNIKNN